jgi:hypothetical protein
MSNYTVRQGDTISKIAAAFRLAGWQSIYNHASNADFKKQRPNPNLIFPGDIVFVPEQQDRTESAATDQRHKYVYPRPSQFLRIAAEDMEGKRMAGQPYEITIDGDLRRGTTDGNGMLTEKVAVDAEETTLRIGDYKWQLQIGALNPLPDTVDNGVSGAQGRLANLGYPTGPIDGIAGPKTSEALRYFQADERLPVTGELDDATREKLQSVHGI